MDSRFPAIVRMTLGILCMKTPVDMLNKVVLFYAVFFFSCLLLQVDRKFDGWLKEIQKISVFLVMAYILFKE